MKASLLDVNLLIALLWGRHEHHGDAHRWFADRTEAGWATCVVTRLGFVRIVSNPAFSPDAVRPAQALEVLRVNLQHSDHHQWNDRWGVEKVLEPFADRLIGHRQITDAYLLGLARKQGGRLATFDGGIVSLAGGSASELVERVPLAGSDPDAG